jgi:multiple sugar transport system permease protein
MTALESPPMAEAPPATPRPPARGRRARRTKYALTVLVFLLPSAIPLAMFTLYPMVGALWTSLHSWNLLSPMQWVGLDNYVHLAQDPATHRAFLNTLYYLVGYLPLVYIGGLALALALNAAIPARNFLRGVYFLPVVTSWIVVALVWRWLLNPDIGIVNFVLGLVGIDGPGWWTDPAWAMPSIIIASAWKDLGFVMIILLAGLQAIPTDLYEAARVDGAGRMRQFFSLTLPLISPAILFNLITGISNGLQVFTEAYVVSSGTGGLGSPDNGTLFYMLYLYKNAFSYAQLGFASAMAVLLFLAGMILSGLVYWLSRRFVNYDVSGE